jgi:hypothetical protein
MDSKYTEKIYTHIVDKNEFILSVSENWRSFSEENFGAETCLPENAVGSSLWSHIRDIETKHLYEIILQKVRRYQRQATFSFRCDSPKERRFLELSVIPMKDGTVEFKSRIIRTESRKPVVLLNPDKERSDDFVRICSVCKKIAISETQWEEVEIAIQKLKLFEKYELPQFTHGVCRPCYDATMAELDKLG